jgi:PRKR-interacting protein 1
MSTQNEPKRKRPPPKKRPRNLSPASEQRYKLESLLQKPDQEIALPWKERQMELLPPDILLNIQGSSAGAGSGEFHVYKAARKREFERINKFEEEIEREESEKKFLREREEKARVLAEKTAKNRKRREKKKGKKEGGLADKGVKKEKVGLKIVPRNGFDDDEEEIEEGDQREAPEALVIIEDEL